MENQEVNIEQTIQDAVTQAMGNLDTERKEMRQSIVDELVPQIKVVDEVCPGWMRDVANFMNAGYAKAQGDHDRSKRYFTDFSKSRKEATDIQKRMEHDEAMRIIKESRLSRPQQLRTQSTLTGEAGGHLLPKPFLAEIFVRVEEYGLARRLFRGIPMGSKSIDLKALTTKPIMTWTAELGRISATELAFSESQLVAKKLAALLPWSFELEEDEVFGLVSFAVEMFAEAIAKKEDEAGFLGAGAGDTANGEFTGVFNLAANEVHEISGTTFSGITFDDISVGRHKLTLAGARNSVYVAHHSIQGVLERIKGTDGHPIYRYPQGGQPATLYGAPMYFSEALPGTGEEYQDDRVFMAYGNFANMLFGTRRNVNFDISREGVIADSSHNVVLSAFQQDAAIARVTERIGFASPLAKSFVVWRTEEES
jgi:HK97 family phage major capsid protein